MSDSQSLPATNYYFSGSDAKRNLVEGNDLVMDAAPTSFPHAATPYYDTVINRRGLAEFASEDYHIRQHTIESSALALLNRQHSRNMLANAFAFDQSLSGATSLVSSLLPPPLFSAATSTVFEGPDYRSQSTDSYLDHHRLLSWFQDASLPIHPTTQQLLSTLVAAGPSSSMLPQSCLLGLQLPHAFTSHQGTLHQSNQYNILQASQAQARNGESSLEPHSVSLGGLETDSFLTKLLRPSGFSDSPPALVSNPTSSRLALSNPLFDQHQQQRRMAEASMSKIMDLAPRGRESFPMLLHRVMAELELFKEGANIATFMSDGKSFQITNQFLFKKEVLPVFFPKMKGFASFQRQLNLYDFKRIGGAGIDRGAYRHDLFVRDSPDIASKMKRRKIKGRLPHGQKSCSIVNES